MNRVYLPLLPLPVLAVIVAVSACSKKNEEPSIHLIPPAVAMPAPEPAATPAPAPEAPAPKDAVAARTEDEKPTAQDVKEFNRKMKK
jgi:hypothetical protein